jgi:hypothetical protein
MLKVCDALRCKSRQRWHLHAFLFLDFQRAGRESDNLKTFFGIPSRRGLAYHVWVGWIDLLKHCAKNRSRIFAAVACLLAVLCLYAPLAGAAWPSNARACCTDGYCNIPRHHHQKAPTNSAAGEDCAHNMGGMMNCSMSCCQDPDKQVITAVLFVLPTPLFADSATPVTPAVTRVRSLEIPRTIEPLSPPPRVDAAL